MLSSNDITNNLVCPIDGNEFICPISAEIFNDPVIAGPCSHIFEKECLATHQSVNNSKCPCCRGDIIVVINAPKIFKNMIQNMTDKYPHLLTERYLSSAQIKATIEAKLDDNKFYQLVCAKEMIEIAVENLNNLFNVNFVKGNFAEAIILAKKILHLQPNNKEILTSYANLNFNSGNLLVAIDSLDKLNNLEPNCVSTLEIRAVAKMYLKDWDGAMVDYLACYINASESGKAFKDCYKLCLYMKHGKTSLSFSELNTIKPYITHFNKNGENNTFILEIDKAIMAFNNPSFVTNNNVLFKTNKRKHENSLGQLPLAKKTLGSLFKGM